MTYFKKIRFILGIQGQSKFQSTIRVVHYFSTVKGKPHYHFSMHKITLKSSAFILGKLWIEENVPNLINGNYAKFINIMKINAFFLILRTRQGCLLFLLPVNIVLEETNQYNMVWERNKSNIGWKGRSKAVIILRWYNHLCRTSLKIYENSFERTNNEFNRWQSSMSI